MIITCDTKNRNLRILECILWIEVGSLARLMGLIAKKRINLSNLWNKSAGQKASVLVRRKMRWKSSSNFKKPLFY